MSRGDIASHLKSMKLFFRVPDMFREEANAMLSRAHRVSLFYSLYYLPERSISVTEWVWKEKEDVEGLLSDLDYIKELTPITESTKSGKKITRIYIMHAEHPPLITELMKEALIDYHCFFEYPWSLTEEGGTLYIAGKPESLRKILHLLDSVPEADYQVLSISKYIPGGRGVIGALTPGQHRAIETAVKKGYYDIPRRCDLRDIARELGVNHSTVETHLRKAEKKMMETLFLGEEANVLSRKKKK